MYVAVGYKERMERTKPLGVRVSPDLKTVLVKAAKAEDRSLASLVERVLTEWVSKQPRPAKDAAEVKGA